MWNKIKNWIKPEEEVKIIDMTAEDFDGIAEMMYKIVDFALYDNHPVALEALEVIADAYEEAAEMLRRG
jgi:hypothetical protein